MKNRAKCKLCESIIESFHRFDYVTCKCGEISITGGNDCYEAGAKDWSNFLRVDDKGNVIVPKIVDSEKQIDTVTKPTKEELIQGLRLMAKSYDSMPSHALHAPATNSDLQNLILYIIGLFEAKND